MTTNCVKLLTFAIVCVATSLSLAQVENKKPAAAAANVKPTVTGTFKGNGKEARLAYISAHWREPFDDKASIVLVFTEKDHSKDNKPDFNAGFGKFGSALIISLHEDGSIFGCEVVHTALKKPNFSSVGKIKANNFKYADGEVEGELTTDGEDEFFGDRWEVANLKFVTSLGPTPPEFQPKTSASESSESITEEKSEKTEKKAPADRLDAKDLAITKDATDVEYKALVEQMSFKSPSNVKNVCAELTRNLKAQGWTNSESDLITAQSSILNRKRGEAKLTIFVKPDGSGSTVSIIAEGLSWDGL